MTWNVGGSEQKIFRYIVQAYLTGDYDDISTGYQPPLALVNVKWVDANNTGAVDTQNRPDYLMLQFSRNLFSRAAVTFCIPTGNV